MTASEPAIALYYQWQHRLFGVMDTAGVFWRLAPNHPAGDWIRDTLADKKRETDDGSVAFYTYRTLLPDVLHGCAGVLRSADAATLEIAAVNSYVQVHSLTSKDADRTIGLVHPAIEAAYFEYVNLLAWLRTTADRLKSQVPTPTHPDIGLLPSLSRDHALFGRVQNVVRGFLSFAKAERGLANYALHLHAIPGGGTPRAEIDRRGKVRLRIPDAISEPAYVFDQLTWDTNRDIEQFVGTARERTIGLADGLIEAFAAESAIFGSSQGASE